MKNHIKHKRSRYAQNKIDYIVFGNPSGAKKLLFEKGYQPLANIQHTAQAIKQLVKKEGRQLIKELIQIHPDKALILKTTGALEDSFCGACSNYTYVPETNSCSSCGHSNFNTSAIDVGDILDQLVNMNTSEMETYYKEILGKSNKDPKDLNLADEVQIVWNELRQRKTKDLQEKDSNEKKEVTTLLFSERGVIILGLTLVAGILIGSKIK